MEEDLLKQTSIYKSLTWHPDMKLSNLKQLTLLVVPYLIFNVYLEMGGLYKWLSILYWVLKHVFIVLITARYNDFTLKRSVIITM
jgi:hypothetical protein